MSLFLRDEPVPVHRARSARFNQHRAITASAERIDLNNPKSAHINRTHAEWQASAWIGYRRVGEIHYGFSLLANLLSRVRLYAAVVGEANESPRDVTSKEVDKDKISEGLADAAAEAMADLTAEDFSSFVRKFSLNLSVPGECYLVHMPDVDNPADRTWMVCSTSEITIRPGGATTYSPMRGEAPRQLPKDTFIARMWRQNPEFCADDQTEILTTEGWKTHDQLQVGDVALTLNHETGASSWQPVEQVNRFVVQDRPMHVLKSYTHSSVTTGAHRWPTVGLHSGKRFWKTSDTLTTSDVLTSAAPCADLPTEQKWSDALVALVGWWWTEGHDGTNTTIAQSYRVNPQHCDTIRANLTEVFGPAVSSKAEMMEGVALRTPTCTFDPCEDRNWAKGLCKAHDAQRRRGVTLKPIRRQSALADRQEPHWREAVHKTNGMISFVLNRAAAAVLREIAPKRQVSSEFIQQLTRSQLELFIRTSIDADGHEETRYRTHGEKEYGPYQSAVITQTKKEMLDPFFLACVLAGYAPRYSNPKEGLHRVVIGTTTRVHVESLERTIETYSGVVWCPTTANQSWMARREGTVFFTGNSREADSSMVGVADSVEELLLCQRLVRGAARSRMNAGLVFLPDGLTVARTSPTGEPVLEEPDDDITGLAAMAQVDPGNDLAAQLMDSMVTPIGDEGSAAGVVPLILIGQTDQGAAIRHVSFERGSDEWLVKRAEVALDRILQGIDIPKELVTGMQEVKYSNAVVINEDLYKSNIEPLALVLADSLTQVYLRPVLKSQGFTDEQLRNIVIWYDPSEIVTRPNAATSANEGWDRGLLGSSAWRRENGFAESDAPSAEDAAQLLLGKLTTFPDSVVLQLLEKILKGYVAVDTDPETAPPSQGQVLPFGKSPSNAKTSAPAQAPADPQRTAIQQVGVEK